jgi:hypothetical protein
MVRVRNGLNADRTGQSRSGTGRNGDNGSPLDRVVDRSVESCPTGHDASQQDQGDADRKGQFPGNSSNHDGLPG